MNNLRTLLILLMILLGPSGYTQDTLKSKKLNAMIEKGMKEWQIPGLSAVVVKNGEVTIKVKFKDIQVAVGYGMTSAIIKHRCVEQAYAKSPWSKIKNQKDDRFEVVVEKENIE